MEIDATELSCRELNNKLRARKGALDIKNCLGQRFIGAGLSQGQLKIYGISGNALGAYLDGAEIIVNGNVQDATGDTMNDGKIIVHGNAGDALGYSMRGGRIYIKGGAGYRTGVHMKEYQEKKPVIIVGGSTGNFLGEYLAGGIIIVLNLNGKEVSHEFTGMGMHGGKIIIRQEHMPIVSSPNIRIALKDDALTDEIKNYITEFCDAFKLDCSSVLDANFYMLSPDSKNPFKQHYTIN